MTFLHKRSSTKHQRNPSKTFPRPGELIKAKIDFEAEVLPPDFDEDKNSINEMVEFEEGTVLLVVDSECHDGSTVSFIHMILPDEPNKKYAVEFYNYMGERSAAWMFKKLPT